eukprot:gene56724-biopygen15234
MPKHRRRAPEILLTLFSKGHRVDPFQVIPFRTLTALRRLVSRRQHLLPTLRDVWKRRTDAMKQPGSNLAVAANTAEGPMKRALIAAEYIGWKWTAPTVFTDHLGHTRDFLATPAQEWAHHIRDAARLTQWKAAQKRRKEHSDDMGGIEKGIDRRATLALHSHRYTSPLQMGFLRTIITGGELCGKRLGQMFPDLYPGGVCTFCSTASNPVVETITHIWWKCPTWEAIRCTLTCRVRCRQATELRLALRHHPGGLQCDTLSRRRPSVGSRRSSCRPPTETETEAETGPSCRASYVLGTSGPFGTNH